MFLSGISVHTDKQFLDELYARIKRGTIRVQLKERSETYARILVFGNGRDGRYGFEVTAYPPPAAEHSNG